MGTLCSGRDSACARRGWRCYCYLPSLRAGGPWCRKAWSDDCGEVGGGGEGEASSPRYMDNSLGEKDSFSAIVKIEGGVIYTEDFRPKEEFAVLCQVACSEDGG